jgi:hypothetical protein
MKQTATPDLNRLYPPALVLVFAIGVAFRVYALFAVGFDEPFDLGGLFYQMSLEIARNGFAMPVSIPYYYPGGLPFAYPPLAFYIQAALIRLFSPPLFLTVNLLPALFSVLSVGAFYLLAKEVIPSRWQSLAALFIFAIIPLAVTEQVQAMGLAESLGTGALILYTRALVRAGRRPGARRWLAAGLMLALCVVSSPGSLYAAVLISLLFFAVSIYTGVKLGDWRRVRGCIIIGISGLILSAPYWLTVIANHGFGILTSAFAGQNTSLLVEIKENILAFRLIWVMPWWNALFLLCLGLILLRKQFLLFLFTALLLVIIRERWIMSIAVSLVIGVGVGVALDLLSRLRWKKNALVKVAVTWTLALVLLYDAGAYLVYSINEEIYDLPAERVADLQLIRSAQMIPPDGSVIAVGSLGLVEWSPALLEREVLNNPFGLEWIAGREEEMHYLTSQLQSVTDPLDYAPLIRQYFPRTRKVYLVLDNAWISPAVLSGIDAEDLTILAVFDHLTLVSLELHDRSPLTFDSLP